MSERDTVSDPGIGADDGVTGDTGRDYDTISQPSTQSVPARHARSCIPVLLAMLVIGGVAAAAVLFVFRGADGLRDRFAGPEDFGGDGRGAVTVEVADGDSASDIAATLERKGVVASADAFTDAAAADEESTQIQPGYYGLRREMSAESALAVLLSPGAKIEEKVSLAEGLTAEETLTQLARQTRISVPAYREAARRPARLGLPDYAGGNLEGYLFPATYALPPQVGASDVLSLMVDRFAEAADELELEAGAEELGYSPAEVVTVASLVQAEAKRDQDFAKVAAVIYNRLDSGQPLQLDSTVQFASGGTDVFTSARERETSSDYNTYQAPGLPPGPIDAPGEVALQAALNPVDANYTYFVTVDLRTGRTEFTDSYDVHLQNVEKLRAYCQTSDAC